MRRVWSALTALGALIAVAGGCKRGTLGGGPDGGASDGGIVLGSGNGGAGGGAGGTSTGGGNGGTTGGDGVGGGIVIGRDGGVSVDALADGEIDAPGTDGPIWVNTDNLGFCPQSLPLQPCPAAPPVAGSPCAVSGARCDYGDGPNVDCRAIWGCGANQTWELRLAECAGVAATACPAEVVNGEACDTPVSCSYPDGKFCTCGAGAMQWACWTSPIVDCPPQLPAYGSPCGPSWMFCRYGGCFDYEAACCGGHWIPGRYACSGGP